MIGLGIVIAVGAVAGAYRYYRSLRTTAAQRATPSPTPSPSPTVFDPMGDQYQLTMSTVVHAESQGYEARADQRTDERHVSVASTSLEALGGCPGGRLADGRASGEVQPGAGTLFDQSAVLTLEARAQSGLLMSPPCNPAEARLRDASARVTGSVQFLMSFVDAVRAAPYEVQFDAAVNRSEGPRALRILAEEVGSGKGLEGKEGVYRIAAAPSARFRFRVEAELAGGGAPKAEGSVLARTYADVRAMAVTVAIRVRRLPIIEAIFFEGRAPALPGEFQPYVIGGEETDGFSGVGALLINKRLHCTGTLIGQATVLTSAHCLAHSYGEQIRKGEMVFRLGPNAFKSDAPTYKVKDALIPRGEQGFQYAEPVGKPLVDDIGVVHLDTAVPEATATPYPLHEMPPTLAKDQGLDFVGFGYVRLKDNSLVGAGPKRHATIPVRQLETKRFYYGEPNKQTCSGDSGGPALLFENPRLMVAGVTSGGDKQCSAGAVDSRVEAYKPWLDLKGVVLN